MVEQYPASVTIPEQAHYGRFWAVPVLGNGIKGILAIPHNFLLYFVQIWVLINQLVLWIPVLTNGEYSPRGARLMTGYFRWQTRLAAWLFGLSDKYPPFGFSEEHPVDVQVTIGSNYNRFWAFPVIGLGVLSQCRW